MSKHPIQPLDRDSQGVVRFKANAIVQHLLEHGRKTGCDLNALACMDFTPEDHMQLAQLIGYSLGGYAELSYVDGDSYGCAEAMAKGKSENEARIEYLESELLELRKQLRRPIARLFGVHEEDLHLCG